MIWSVYVPNIFKIPSLWFLSGNFLFNSSGKFSFIFKLINNPIFNLFKFPKNKFDTNISSYIICRPDISLFFLSVITAIELIVLWPIKFLEE